MNNTEKIQLFSNKKSNGNENYSKRMIVTKIINCVDDLFDIEVLDYDVTFSEYGIESVSIPLFVEKLKREFNINLTPADMFTYFTVSLLSNYIDSLINTVESEISLDNSILEQPKDKIAIVGISGRFPGGANTIDEFWDLLIHGVDGVGNIPNSRWDVEKYYDEDKSVPGKMYCKKGGFLNIDIDEFDARFFNISPKEAAALDPQQRLLLELTWEAYENANIDLTKCSGTNTGVYLGIANNEYNLSQLYSGDLTKIGAYSLTGSCISTACGRLSYTFGFEGPCIAVDTACSSTLTALHLACTALQSHEADMQVVAGINLMESPTTNVGFSKLQATSEDGLSKAFDATANGYGRGEGGGVILLKRLSDAITDNNEILGIVRGTGINQDGRSNGLTAPNGEAQSKLIRKTLNNANLNSLDVDYVEMHGTGTKLGDPIEVSAVAETYGKGRNAENPLKIGSVKSNIGHLEASAGIASIVKVLLSMKYHIIPANLHFNTPNPFINWEDANVEVINKNTPWIKNEGVRAAAINGFGFGGSNAHVIIEEYKKEDTATRQPQVQDGIDYILKISAKSEKSLKALIEKYHTLVNECTDSELEDIIYTANIYRADLDYRFTVCGSNRDMILERIGNYLKDGYSEGVVANTDVEQMMQKDRKVVFMFSGQGSQYVNMGRLLYKTNEVFKQSFDACDILFQPYLRKSISELIYGENADEQVIEKTAYAQPLIFAVEFALYKFWESYGVKPEIVMGHSIGEYAAAVAANIISLEDAIKLVASRGRLMDMAPGKGMMVTIFAEKDKVHKLLKDDSDAVCIAAHNAKDNCVISGRLDEVENVETKAIIEGIKTKRLKVSHGFHSMLMAPILEDFKDIAKDISYKTPQIRFISSLYANELKEDQALDSEYWTRHIREQVDFYGAITSIDKKENYLFLEIGANRVLAALCKLIFGEDRAIASTLNLSKADTTQLAEQIAYLYTAGVNVDWSKIIFGGRANWKPTKLPNYPFEKSKYWMDLQYDRETEKINIKDCHNILGQRIDLPYMNDAVVFQSTFTAMEPYFMREHVIFDTAISPAAAHMAMMISAVKEIGNAKSLVLSNIEFRAPLAAKDEEQRQVQICIEKGEEDSKFTIVSRDADSRNEKWLLHAKGNLSTQSDFAFKEMKADIDQYNSLDFDDKIEDSIYYFMEKSGFNLGNGFRRIKRISYGENDCICVVEPLKTVPYYHDYVLYPGTVDSILQTGIALVLEKLKERTNVNEAGNKTVIPYYLENLTYNYRESEQLWCYSKSSLKNDITYADVIVYNEKGEVLLKIDNLMAKITDSNSLLREMKNLNKLYYHTDWMETVETIKIDKIPTNKKFILYADEKYSLDVLSEKMKELNLMVVSVLAGKGYQKVNELEYVINAEMKEDWSRLFSEISINSTKTDLRIIYCTTKDYLSMKAGEQINYEAVKGLLYLMQVINEEGYAKGSKVKIVSKDVQKLENVKKLNLSGSMVWGLAKVIAMEYSEVFGGVIDADEAAFYESATFIHEVLGEDVQEICLRGTKRYAGRLISHGEYLKKGLDKKKKIVMKADASYLITGGTGALGLMYAEQFVKGGAKNLILLCRQKPGKKAMETIEKFIDQGIQVNVVYTDVCEFEHLKKTIDEVKTNMPPIKGVVHTAGVLNDKMLTHLAWNEFEKVLNPKVAGTLNIYNTVNMEELDFFMMLSSITSIVGNMGQANYASANYFMNAFAVHLGMEGLPGFTFCWGPFMESGMAAGKDAVANTMEKMGMKTFGKEQGCKIIEDFMDQPYENLLIADVVWNSLGDSLKHAAGKNEFLSKLISEVNMKEVSEPDGLNSDIVTILENLSEEERKDFLIDKLQGICGKIMGYEKGLLLSVDEAFQVQGADSLMIFSMRTAVNKLLGTDVNVAVFFNYPSIVKLAEYLLDEILILEEDDMVAITTEAESESIEEILSEISMLTL